MKPLCPDVPLRITILGVERGVSTEVGQDDAIEPRPEKTLCLHLLHPDDGINSRFAGVDGNVT